MMIEMMIEALTEEVEDLGLTGRDINEEQDAYTIMMIMMVILMMIMVMMVIDDNDGNDDSDDDEVEPTYLCKRMPLF